MKDPDRAWIWLGPLIVAAFAGVAWLVTRPLPGPVSIQVELAPPDPNPPLHPWTMFIDAKVVLFGLIVGLIILLAAVAIVRRRRRAKEKPQDEG